MAKHNALELLRGDHKKVQQLFKRVEKADEKELREIVPEVCSELKTHTQLEEKIFYPYVRESTQQELLLEEAAVEHAAAKNLIAELEKGADGVHARAVLDVLREYVGHHIREEEEKIFPLVEKLGVDLEALGLELEERKAELQGKPRPSEALQGSPKGGGHEKKPMSEKKDTTKEDRAFLKEHGEDLSPSTQRAKWIHSVDEHEDHPGQTLATRNHGVIRRWAEERKARPATIGSNEDPNRPRVLRFDFPDYDKGLQQLDWEAWFRTFDERNLVFIYQEHMKAGNQSNFFRLDNPEREDA